MRSISCFSGLSCRNLPQIMEVGEKDGRTALLEEYVQGDTLGEILEGGVLTTGQAKQITASSARRSGCFIREELYTGCET